MKNQEGTKTLTAIRDMQTLLLGYGKAIKESRGHVSTLDAKFLNELSVMNQTIWNLVIDDIRLDPKLKTEVKSAF